MTRSRNALFPAASPDQVAAAAAPVITKNDDRISTIVVVGLYCILQIVMAVQHDPWIDEAQAWLWATTITRWQDFFVIPGEGHPPLWYWVLKLLSFGLDFSQARFVTVPIAVANAFLLARLLRGQFLLLTMMLFSFAVVQFWGYHFRPYSIVFFAMISALLLDRAERPVAATWCLAIACGFHFFAGFLFAFWLVWQWRKGTPLLQLVLPSLIAAAFGISAVLSGLGNVTAGVSTVSLLEGTIGNLSWAIVSPDARHPLIALLTLGLLGYGLRREPILLVALMVLLVTFAAGSSAVYGKYPWHFAFMTMMCFIAFMVTAPKAKSWVMLVLLAPQVVFGVSAVSERLTHPAWAEADLFEVISTDAGPTFQPSTQLVAWPDISGLTTAAIENVTLLSGNDGATMGPVDWRTWEFTAFDDGLLTMRRPYWVICANCEPLLDHLEQAGLSTKLLAQKINLDNGRIEAFRVE